MCLCIVVSNIYVGKCFLSSARRHCVYKHTHLSRAKVPNINDHQPPEREQTLDADSCVQSAGEQGCVSSISGSKERDRGK